MKMNKFCLLLILISTYPVFASADGDIKIEEMPVVTKDIPLNKQSNISKQPINTAISSGKPTLTDKTTTSGNSSTSGDSTKPTKAMSNDAKSSSLSKQVNPSALNTSAPTTDVKNTESPQELEDKQKQKQLEDYQGSSITKWLIDNTESFEAVIRETAKDTKTKWFIDQDIENLDSKDNKASRLNSVNQLDGNDSTSYPTPIQHIVVSGDTIYSISKKYNVDQNDILSWNNITQGSTIKIGTVLKIFAVDYNKESTSQKEQSDQNLSTQAKNKESQANKEEKSLAKVEENASENSYEIQTTNHLPEYKYYKVKAGDTYYSIADKHKMTVEELLTLNTLQDNNTLTVGNILKVKSNYSDWSITDKKTAQDGFLWPVVGRLLIPFGPQSGGTINEGINILAKKGTPIKATQDGIITYIGSTLKNFGNIMLIQHTNNWVSAYAHIDNIMVTKGQQVKKGDVIARIGTTGNVTKPQLHFELRHKIKPMDPLAYLQGYR